MSLKCPLLQLNVMVNLFWSQFNVCFLVNKLIEKVTVQYCSKVVWVTAQSFVGHISKLCWSQFKVVWVTVQSCVDHSSKLHWSQFKLKLCWSQLKVVLVTAQTCQVNSRTYWP